MQRTSSTHPGHRAVRGLVLLTLLMLPAQAAAQSGPLGGLDDYIESARQAWKIPGLAIAVVKDGEVVYAEGFGVRDVRTGDPVDENTLFAIGSASKAFTTAAIASLVDDGELDWDDRVTRYLPGFQVHDPYVTRELTIRDLLSHRSGLLRGDALWFATDLGPEEILERVRYQEPTSSFRSQFGYNNNMFLAAGQIVERVSGRTWDEYVRDEFFGSLGMERSVTSTSPLSGIDNVAQPHEEVDGEVRAIEWRNIDNIAPAGSINSSVAEMANWVKMQLAKGEFGGRRILSEEVVDEMHEPQTLIRREGAWALMSPDAHFMMYGMGWFLNDYRGHKVVHHGGNIDGMHALVGMLPEQDLGLVVLTNLNPNAVTTALMYRIFDAYLGGEPRDWNAEILASFTEMRELGQARQAEQEASRVSGTRPSLAVDGYVGVYADDMYGTAEVTLEDGGLVLRRGANFVGDLEHWHYDTFQVNWRDETLGETFATFALDATGEVAEVELGNLGEFERVEDPAASR